MKDYLFTQNRDLLASLLSQYQDIGIVVGSEHNLDTVGASLALYLSLQTAGKNVQIVSDAQPIVEISHLVGIDRMKQSFDGNVNMLTVAVPRRGKAIQKVSYNIEGDWVHLNIFAGEEGLNFSEDEVRFIKKGSAPSLIFAVGVSTIQDLEKFAQSDARIINIDNDTSNQLYGDIVMADPSFSSISEITARILEELSLPVDIDIAQNLMDGLVQATNNFTTPTTDANAFQAASFLMKHGALRKTSKDHRGEPPQQVQQSPFDKPMMHTTPRTRPNIGVPQNFPMNTTMPRTNSAPPAFPTNMNGTFDNTDDSIPQDWFTPKVFNSSKKPQD